MKAFLKKIALALIVGFILISIGSHSAYSYIQTRHINYLSYESGLIAEQASHLKEGNDYNTLFLGTSKAYRQIDPLLFDSITAQTKSINMGVNNLYPFRSFDFDSYIAPKCDSIKLIIYELRTPGLIGGNYSSIKTLISISGKRNYQFISYLLVSDFTLKLKVKVLLNYTKMFLYKSLGIGIKRLLDVKEPESYYEYGGATEQGFYSLENQLSAELSNNNKKGAQRDRDKFNKWLKSNDIKTFFNYDRQELINKPLRKSSFSEVTIDHLNKYFPNAEVVFIIPPHTLADFYPNILTEARNLSNHGYSVFDYTDQQKHPLLYEDSTSFDIGHLNNIGAAIYTESLAKDIFHAKQRKYNQ